MKTRTRNLSLGVILTLAIVAFALDRSGFMRPADGLADAVEAFPVEARRNASDAPAASLTPIEPNEPIADPAPDAPGHKQLAWYENRLSVRDLFEPSEVLLENLQGRAEALRAAEATVDNAASRAEAFRRRHRLEATFRGQDGATAVIDGRGYRKGDVVDGFRLVDIEAFSVRFEDQDVAVVMTMSIVPNP